ncbi:MAG: DUF3473 domain-containing protein [Magnetococcales bacterium]|nr:DUF3473 domain-containing protein [Magnetococcales bacterium]
MSVDVEDYFQVAAFEDHIPIEKWNDWPARVDTNTDYMLDIFAKYDVKATFFILGCVAKSYPALLRRIVDAGHEVAGHGMNHVRIFRQTPKEFMEDIVTSKKILEDIGGKKVVGYRAPTYSINQETIWALDLLYEAGYRYSSSIYPVYHDLYGMPDAPRFPYYPRQDNDSAQRGILEIPITTTVIANRRIPCGGGGYFRLYPLAFTRWAWNRVNDEGQPGVFYCHPWEFDSYQPRVENLDWKTRVRHYLNLGKKMESRFKKMLLAYRWDRMDRVYGELIK